MTFLFEYICFVYLYMRWNNPTRIYKSTMCIQINKAAPKLRGEVIDGYLMAAKFGVYVDEEHDSCPPKLHERPY